MLRKQSGLTWRPAWPQASVARFLLRRGSALSRANSSAIRGSRSKSGVLGAVFDLDQTYRVKVGRVVCAIVE